MVSRVLDDVKGKLYYPNFESIVDSKKDTIGMSNGTLNILTGELTDPINSDLISKTTHVDYIPYDMHSRELHMLMKTLRKVFPDEDLLKFFIRSCSTFLEKSNSKKVFYVWWGIGNNCKTGMSELVQSAFGDYCATAPVSLITSKRNGASEATPELCHIEGKLVVFLQEPNPKEKMKTGRIKELTGNDKMFVRQLFEVGREIEIKCKIVHVCNFPTAGPDSDAAFKRRMIVIKFPSTFLGDIEYNIQKKRGLDMSHTFRIKDGIDNIFKNMGHVFMSMLIKEFHVFKEVGLQVPPIVLKNTEEFLTHGNYALKYIKKYLRHSKSPSKYLEAHSIYDLFKSWFRDMYPSYSIPSSETFMKELGDEGFVEDDEGIIYNIKVIESANTIRL